jgi:putative transposase
MVHKWIADVYHQDKHRGLMSIPAIVWKTGVQEFAPALPSSADQLDIMLGMIETRTITDSGIELHNLIYNDDALMSIRRRYKLGVKTKVRVKYDPSDLSTIYVQDEFRKTYSPVRAISQSYTQGLNLWAHRVICRYAREKLKRNLDIASLALAKEEIWRLASAEWYLTKRTGTRVKIARLFNMGQDDHGKFIKQEQEGTQSSAAQSAEQSLLPSDLILPPLNQHPANGISCVGTVICASDMISGDSKVQLVGNATIDADIGKGEFVTTPPKKKGRPKSTKAAEKLDAQINDERSKAAVAVLVDEEEPDLSGWGISYLNK